VTQQKLFGDNMLMTLLSTEDVTVHEETVSDDELPRKTSEINITSPVSPASPPQTSSRSTDTKAEAETVEPESAIEAALPPLISKPSPTEPASESRQTMLPDEKSIEHVTQSTVQSQEMVNDPSLQPTPNMLSQEQVNELISQVIDETHCNVLGQEDRNTIIRFLGRLFFLSYCTCDAFRTVMICQDSILASVLCNCCMAFMVVAYAT
jgi:hypothetical protein